MGAEMLSGGAVHGGDIDRSAKLEGHPGAFYARHMIFKNFFGIIDRYRNDRAAGLFGNLEAALLKGKQFRFRECVCPPGKSRSMCRPLQGQCILKPF